MARLRVHVMVQARLVPMSTQQPCYQFMRQLDTYDRPANVTNLTVFPYS